MLVPQLPVAGSPRASVVSEAMEGFTRLCSHLCNKAACPVCLRAVAVGPLSNPNVDLLYMVALVIRCKLGSV